MPRKKDYDDYGYEYETKYKKTSITKILLIIVLVLIAIFLFLYLLKSCNNGKNNNSNKSNDNTSKFNYENAILDAGKQFFVTNAEEKPKAPGECSVVNLQTLNERKLVDIDKFANCNVSTTYLKVCMLENNELQYTPWLTCMDRISDNLYEQTREGTLSDIIVNETNPDFRFLPQVLKKGEEQLGNVEELWKDEIKYDTYKTLATTTYYRYRDKLYTWNVTNRYYYTSSGEKTKASDVNEYYPISPKVGYTGYSDRTSNAYKWYTATGTKEYYTNANGTKVPSAQAVGDYKIRGEFVFTQFAYKSRKVTGTKAANKYYVCATSASSSLTINQLQECGKGSNPEFKYQKRIFYSCLDANSSAASIVASALPEGVTTCPVYSDWTYSPNACNTKDTETCQKSEKSLDFYYWYKNINEVKKYYPSGSSTASGEKVYYVSAPVSGAIKDTSTQVNAYKWYRESKSVTSNFTAVAPSGYTTATKTGTYRWSDWSSWSTKNPKVSDGRERTIETKAKIKLQQILPSTTTGWENLANEYLTEEGLIKLYQDNKYDVKTLEDIVNNGEIRYQVKMYVRNKKEIK